jgi:hypothetical protein
MLAILNEKSFVVAPLTDLYPIVFVPKVYIDVYPSAPVVTLVECLNPRYEPDVGLDPFTKIVSAIKSNCPTSRFEFAPV